MWRLEVVAETGSTNADVAARARSGEPEGLALVALHQTAGRGRRERGWEAPAGAGLALSVLLRPPVRVDRLGWLPLLGGVAVVRGIAAAYGVQAALKWPNDVLLGGAKLAGLLAEVVPAPSGSPWPAAVVLGIGVNVTQTQAQLPAAPVGSAGVAPTPPTSLHLAGVAQARPEGVREAVLGALAELYRAWTAVGGDPAAGLADAYREVCSTLGSQVEVHLPGGVRSVGEAVDLDDDGRLVVRAADGSVRELSAGDVVHLRPKRA